MTFGERLHRLRTGNQESLQDLANAIGISKAHVWELEKGKTANPSYDIVTKLAAHFGVEPSALVGENEALPEPEDQAMRRIYRGLEGLSERDLALIESMIASMKQVARDEDRF